MQYFSGHLGTNVSYLVFSDDISKAKKLMLIRENDRFNIIFPVFYSITKSSGTVLALLTLVDHSILTYSIFGLWGAMLRTKKGETIMPNETKKTDIGYYAARANLIGLSFI